MKSFYSNQIRSFKDVKSLFCNLRIFAFDQIGNSFLILLFDKTIWFFSLFIIISAQGFWIFIIYHPLRSSNSFSIGMIFEGTEKKILRKVEKIFQVKFVNWKWKKSKEKFFFWKIKFLRLNSEETARDFVREKSFNKIFYFPMMFDHWENFSQISFFHI